MHPKSFTHPRLHSTYIAIGIVVVSILFAGGATFLRIASNPTIDTPIPTLDLEEVKVTKSVLSARLVGEKAGVPVHLFTSQEATVGFTAPKDEHVLFDCPIGTNASATVAHGDAQLFETARYWGYEYTGEELNNGNSGLTGLDMFNGRFWLSNGEMAATGSQYDYLNTVDMQMVAEKRYYLMTSIPLRVSCLDSDNDHLNNAVEDTNSNGILDSGETAHNDADTDDDGITDSNEIILGTNPGNPDTDGDGIQDGTEIGVIISDITVDTNTSTFKPDLDPTTTTDPLNPDTDGGGASDGDEDENHNGSIDAGETDPNDPLDDVTCGNGVIIHPETCDDGSTADNIMADGCSPSCRIDHGWQCTGAPSVCTTTCGDGIIAGVEKCDDGNTDVLEDGCSPSCTIDIGWSCTGAPSVCEAGVVPELGGDDEDDLTIITPAADVTWTAGILRSFQWSAPVNLDSLYADYIDQFIFEISVDGGAWAPFTAGEMTAYRNADDNFEISIGAVVDAQQCLEKPFCGNFDKDFPQAIVFFCTKAGEFAQLNCDGDSIPRAIVSLPSDVQSIRLQITDSDHAVLTDISPVITLYDDSGAPVITLNGPSPFTVEQDAVYNDEGATATDDVDGDITSSIAVSSIVDTSTVGTYSVTYNVTDSDGNAAIEVTRTVRVVVPTGENKCGNAQWDLGEQCDDGNLIAHDGCTNSCIAQVPLIVAEMEQCKIYPMYNDKVACYNRICGATVCDISGCTRPNQLCLYNCGNGVKTAGEHCDDGNTDGGDGCSPSCVVERCGNTIVNQGEECDDGNASEEDGCSNACTNLGG